MDQQHVHKSNVALMMNLNMQLLFENETCECTRLQVGRHCPLLGRLKKGDVACAAKVYNAKTLMLSLCLQVL